MNGRFFERIATLEREHASFAIATVVARRSPVSSHLGDRALVFADGRMEGFVGGSCSRDIVRRQALGTIRSREPVLLQIRNASEHGHDASASENAVTDLSDGAFRPNEVAAKTERIVIPMSCASEGAVDVYIEPRIPARQLMVIGLTPIAEALVLVASSLDYDIVRVVVDEERQDLAPAPGARVLVLAELRDFLIALDAESRASLFAIVASQGHYDELALEALGAVDVAFVGLVASRRRAATVFGVLAQQGIAADRLARIHHPVGLDIGARSPGDVAVSIVAEIIATAALRPGERPMDEVANEPTAVDPVCGMDVETAGARYRFEHAARMHYFCGAGCRAAFAAAPERYHAARGNA